MTISFKVDYLTCSRRHIKDAHILQHAGRRANAGQLFGFSVECGLKALLVIGGAQVDTDGNITQRTGFRKHLPDLGQHVTGMMTLPDGRSASLLQSRLPHLNQMNDWHIDHRYWRTSELPLSSVSHWDMAALEMNDLLDDVVSLGLL